MIVTGITVVAAKRLPGYQRLVPIIVGLWFPVTMVAFTFLQNKTVGFYIMNIYSLVAWFGMGWIVYRNRPKPATCTKLVCFTNTLQQDNIWQEEPEEVYL